MIFLIIYAKLGDEIDAPFIGGQEAHGLITSLSLSRGKTLQLCFQIKNVSNKTLSLNRLCGIRHLSWLEVDGKKFTFEPTNSKLHKITTLLSGDKIMIYTIPIIATQDKNGSQIHWALLGAHPSFPKPFSLPLALGEHKCKFHLVLDNNTEIDSNELTFLIKNEYKENENI